MIYIWYIISAYICCTTITRYTTTSRYTISTITSPWTTITCKSRWCKIITICWFICTTITCRLSCKILVCSYNTCCLIRSCCSWYIVSCWSIDTTWLSAIWLVISLCTCYLSCCCTSWYSVSRCCVYTTWLSYIWLIISWCTWWTRCSTPSISRITIKSTFCCTCTCRMDTTCSWCPSNSICTILGDIWYIIPTTITWSCATRDSWYKTCLSCNISWGITHKSIPLSWGSEWYHYIKSWRFYYISTNSVFQHIDWCCGQSIHISAVNTHWCSICSQ